MRIRSELIALVVLKDLPLFLELLSAGADLLFFNLQRKGQTDKHFDESVRHQGNIGMLSRP